VTLGRVRNVAPTERQVLATVCFVCREDKVLLQLRPFLSNGHLGLSAGPPRTVFGDLGPRRTPSPSLRLAPSWVRSRL
jgi:hypothetical protein